MVSHFQLIENPEGTFRIECQFIVYREKFKRHPSWISPVGDARTGFNTKYYFLVEDDIISNIEVDAKLHLYREKYDKLIYEIEDDDSKWDEFPFKDRPIVYYK